MSTNSKFSGLCNLIGDSLRPYTEVELISLTKSKEKDLLIALSRDFREIQLMKQQLDGDSDKEVTCESVSDEETSSTLELHHDDHNCLSKIVADLIILLAVESQFVQHLVGNILVAVSEFVAVSGCEWDSFIRSLFICLELAIVNMLPRSLEASTNGTGDLNCDSSTFVVFKFRLRNAKWSTAAAIVRVLRNTLKYLKQEDDGQLCEAYSGSVTSFLLNVPWDFMDEVQVGQDGGTKESDSFNSHSMCASFARNVGEKGIVMFLGNFIQFLSSLVEQCCDVETNQDHHPVLCIMISLVPKLLHWCLSEQRSFAKIPISHYFRHKLLMLMLRLSYQTCLGSSTLISWLQLLHDYFEELLWKPIIKLDSGQDDFLEDSPFLLCLSDREVHGLNSDHLQRWAILLYLRCCFGLISMKKDASKECACGTTNSCSTFCSIPDLNRCGRKKGFLKLFKWLQEHIPTRMFADSELYFEKFIGFASSFLQLYMHEDDLLFKVLLQLLSIQSWLEQLPNEEKWAFEDVQEDIVFHISSVFNPVFLFHLFLTKLHYDHQVLLDYLISKDTGISCAEYLLRCLRIVCNSWQLFLTFSMHVNIVNHSYCKKRKIFLDGSKLLMEASYLPVKDIPSSHAEKHKKDLTCSSKHCKTTRPLFKEAKNCLLSLKYSVENLHDKNLFPYNPEVLLKRLTKFQELCFDQKNHGP